MTTAKDILQPVLANSGMSRRALAAATGSSVAGLNEVFHGQKDATVGRVTKLLNVLDSRLIPVPTRLPPVYLAAQTVAERLDRGEYDNALRAVYQIAEDLRHADPATRVVLAITPPTPTGDPRFDAFIAGVVEWELGRDKLPLPKWILESTPLNPPWDIEPVESLRAEGRLATPEALAKHGVFIEEESLINV